MIGHVCLAFVSGVVIEALYALGVLLIGARQAKAAALSSLVWGGAFLVGVDVSLHNPMAAGAWCVGLAVGTLAGIWIEPLIARLLRTTTTEEG